MRPWQIAATLLSGFLVGGFAHLWFVGSVGYAAIVSGGRSGFGWNVKSVGENIGAGTLLYLLGLLLYAFIGGTIIVTMIVYEWWYWRSFPFRRTRLRAFLIGLAFALLGALGAITVNQHKIAENYVYAATLGEWFEAGTIALPLPAMQAFTADCQRALLFLLLLTLLGWGGERWLRQRRTVRPADA